MLGASQLSHQIQATTPALSPSRAGGLKGFIVEEQSAGERSAELPLAKAAQQGLRWPGRKCARNTLAHQVFPWECLISMRRIFSN